MVALLNTSSLLWALIEPQRLSKAAVKAVGQDTTTLSVVSYWELVIKSKKGLLPIAD